MIVIGKLIKIFNNAHISTTQVLKSSRISGMSGMSADIMKTLSSVQLPCGVTVSAVQGDLTQMSVDVIVNAANSRMDHMGGLARHIVEKGIGLHI